MLARPDSTFPQLLASFRAILGLPPLASFGEALHTFAVDEALPHLHKCTWVERQHFPRNISSNHQFSSSIPWTQPKLQTSSTQSRQDERTKVQNMSHYPLFVRTAAHLAICTAPVSS